MTMEGLRVAIVGSGPAGFFCADRLTELAAQGDANLRGKVHLFRSRSKMSASQMETEHNTIFPRRGQPFFDYGCQYVTAGDEWFRSKMERYEKAGICHRWPVGVLSKEGGFEMLDPVPGWAGQAGMWKLQEDMVANIAAERKDALELHHSVNSWPPRDGQKFPDQSPLVCETFQKHTDGTWTLRNGRGDTFGPFDVLIGAFVSHNHTNVQLNTPATKRMKDYLHDNLCFSPVITAMVIFDRPLGLKFNAAFVAGDHRLAWVSRNNGKVGSQVPFEADGREFWTFIAPAQYSCESFEKDAKGYKRRAFEDFLAAFGDLVGRDLWQHRPHLVRALHWESGLPCTTPPSDAGCVFDQQQSLGWCGHWALYGSVEGAAVSGKKMAELVAQLSRGAPVPANAGYQDKAWLDIGCRLSALPGYIRLGHGFFHVQHARLESIAPPTARLSSTDTQEFWGKLGAWGYGGNARSKGQDPNGQSHNWSRNNGKGKGKGHNKGVQKTWEPMVKSPSSRRRWGPAAGG
eukprot:gnl/TRDRNA2_/TRDRNA2_188750_c0_seq1.p1 gnl/TRDRNA2_/TRDRNA2_188750_c0~~gnl/TRDRNA2_/TRDRNA2_188750_c0_seq1.p1  ORF type:complete len:516 (-),score=85.31 gnl/TRDRNA2_/TRDRNA2_188750_c0_seq1:148-1695(-)